MCTGKCARCIAFSLYPFVLLSIICNIVLFFPGWDVKYAKERHITEEVKYMGGLIGGGIMVSCLFFCLLLKDVTLDYKALIPALYFSFTGEEGCCGNRFGMFLSIIFAAVGVTGAVYSFVVAVLGVGNGPLCLYSGNWTTPFKHSNVSYLSDSMLWTQCKEPAKVVQFNTGLFFTLAAASLVQGLLCVAQMINGLVGCLFGLCANKEEP